MFETGLVSISFRKLSPEEIAEKMLLSGLRFVEWGSDVHAVPTDEAALQRIVELQKKTGIRCSSYGTYFRLGVNPVEELPAYFDAAKTLGTDILRVWCGNQGYAASTKEYRESIIGEAKKIAAMAEEAGVTVCLECHNNTLTDELEGALEVMHSVNSPNFRMYWQPNQFKSVETNLAYAEAIAPYTKVIHCFNWKEKEKYPLALSIALWRRYLRSFDGSQKVLLEFMPDNDPESLPAEAESLRWITAEEL